MKKILSCLALMLVAIVVFAGRKTRIIPIPWTNDRIVATQLAVDTANRTDVSIDLIWYLYKDNDSLIDEGSMQIADSDLIRYNQKPDSFMVNYICDKRGFVRIK